MRAIADRVLKTPGRKEQASCGRGVLARLVSTWDHRTVNSLSLYYHGSGGQRAVIRGSPRTARDGLSLRDGICAGDGLCRSSARLIGAHLLLRTELQIDLSALVRRVKGSAMANDLYGRDDRLRRQEGHDAATLTPSHLAGALAYVRQEKADTRVAQRVAAGTGCANKAEWAAD